MNKNENPVIYRIVLNNDAQYSIWPVCKDIPKGWMAVGKEGLKQDCLEYIKKAWVDMRPRSLHD